MEVTVLELSDILITVCVGVSALVIKPTVTPLALENIAFVFLVKLNPLAAPTVMELGESL